MAKTAKKVTPKRKPASRSRRKPARWQWPQLSARSWLLGSVLIAAAAGHFAIPDWPDRLEQEVYRITGQQGLQVRNIVLENRGRTDQLAILKALAVREGTPILSVDISEAQARLEDLPWVADAVVARKLPDTLYIRLSEHTPVAVWQDGRQYHLLSQSGQVIDLKPAGEYNQLLVLSGQQAPDKAVDLLAMLARHPDLAQRVKSAALFGERRWTVYFDNDLTLHLPEQQPFAAWDKFAANNRRHDLLGRPIAIVDLRLPDRFVIKPAEQAPKEGNSPS